MTPQQKIFKILIEHNRVLEPGDVDTLLARTPDPENVIVQLVEAEQITAHFGDKLLDLYRHNLEKKHLEVTKPSAPAVGAAPSAHVIGTTKAAIPAVPRPAAHASPVKIATTVNAAPVRAAPVHPASPFAATVLPERTRVSVSKPFAPPAGPAIEMLHGFFRQARELHASDLHLMSGAVPIVRVASCLLELKMASLAPEQVEACLRSILTPEQNHDFDESSDLDFSYDAGPELGRFRGNFLRQHRGMDGVFRLIPDRIPSFEELKLPSQVRRFTQFRQGIVLVTGPKGSGKTTTLAMLIDLINSSRPEHIITIEDPIEFVHPCKVGLVDQREVGTHTDSFANALRASLHEAPDVIMVGEMRDLETTSLAITAAETGHLVFGTLHTPDAARTIGRVIDVFPAKDQGQIRAMFSESLRGVLSQQLLPGLDGQSLHLATEMMFNSNAIGNLIRDNRAFQIHGIIQTHRHEGMHLMDDSLINLVRLDKVAPEEALSRANNLHYVQEELTAAAR